MISRKPISPDQPEPLFASFTWFERALLGTATLTVALGFPFILLTMWSLR